MAGKRGAALLVAVPAAALAALTTQAWATGHANDVLSHGTTSVTGTEAMPAVIGLTIVAVAALVALMTGGRAIRVVSAVLLVAAALGALALVLLVALRPEQVVADAVARELARTTAPAATGTSTVIVWVAVAVAVLLAAGAVLAAARSRGWAGLGSRYERDTRPTRGPRGETRGAWDELSEGRDPTVGEDEETPG
ncbi:MAG: Trp biosynthesis-associated membrane protein [Intrasporangium sp.]|uniref:Trp biosynthesis-associated membrane protein n=1 Tax=Intrasporangium sp. TaxID=1925024 RepID=UPI002649C252|nr:Trp biosynthesis-associated membrane protein [Intrasporangium sp.]MDN5795663.1 Trp biosynthesis-associated membrane protein [Intrasporangium sp.]